MSQTPRHQQIDELLLKFKDGQFRYKESALFHKVIDSLQHGSSFYDIIDQLIQITENNQKLLEEHYVICDYILHNHQVRLIGQCKKCNGKILI